MVKSLNKSSLNMANDALIIGRAHIDNCRHQTIGFTLRLTFTNAYFSYLSADQHFVRTEDFAFGFRYW
jgi:hypothetical protein